MFVFALSTLLIAAPPAVPAPSLRVGEELIYTGDIVEDCVRPEMASRRHAKIEVRYLVLSVRDGVTYLAALTLLQPLDDVALAKFAVETAGGVKETSRKAPVTRLEFLRIDRSGSVSLLKPEIAPPPILWSNATTKPLPTLPLDAPNAFETGPFPLRPAGGARPGATWTDPSVQPITNWTANPTMVLGGAEVIELSAEQSTPDWGNPTLTDRPWKRTERVWLSPTDGIARVLWRRVERADGPRPAFRIETRLDLQPTVPHRGEGLRNVQREIEFAWWFSVQCDELPEAKRPQLKAQIQRYRDDYPATTYREAIDAVSRRLAK